MKISIIVAVGENGVIGSENKLIWHLSDDLKNFKRVTLDHFIVMGRKTFESIGRPLPGRTNIILTRQTDYAIEGCVVMHSLDSTVAYAEEHKQEEIFIIGGAEIYSHALSFADKLYLTRVADSPQGDAFFPAIHSKDWKIVSRKSFTCNKKNEKNFEILEMQRIKHETGVVD